jgi:hypothetical protein
MQMAIVRNGNAVLDSLLAEPVTKVCFMGRTYKCMNIFFEVSCILTASMCPGRRDAS